MKGKKLSQATSDTQANLRQAEAVIANQPTGWCGNPLCWKKKNGFPRQCVCWPE